MLLQHKTNMTINPLVSIVIPTRDSNPETNSCFKICLESINRQTYPNIQIIIVCEGYERSKQRNIGISKATGKYIYSLDDDHYIPPTLISQAVSTLENEPFDFLCIDNRFLNSDILLQQVRRIEREIALEGFFHIAGCFFRRDILPSNPFNESLNAGEDYELHSKLLSQGYTFKRLSEIYATHLKEPTSLSQVIKQNIYYGKSIRTYLKPVEGTSITKTERMISVQPFRISYFKNFHRFNPQQFIYFLVYQYIRYISALIGMINHK